MSAINWDELGAPTAQDGMPTIHRVSRNWDETPLPKWIEQANGRVFSLNTTRANATELSKLMRLYVSEKVEGMGLSTKVKEFPGNNGAPDDKVTVFFQVRPKIAGRGRPRGSKNGNSANSGSEKEKSGETPSKRK